MKREQYKITLNDDEEFIKHKWNSSIRFIESVVRKKANEEKTVYSLGYTESIKDVDGYYARGIRSWEGVNGSVLVFEIEKQ